MFQYKRNSRFFHIPTIYNSYWAGFIAADGSICKDRCILRLTLNDKDHKHLLKFKSDIEYEGKITKRSYPNINTKFYSILEIYDKTIYNDLILKWNIIPNKSLKLQPPNNLSKYQQYSYIIGLIDGDGSIKYNKNGSILQISITCTKFMASWIQKVLNKKGRLYPYKKKNNITVELRWNAADSRYIYNLLSQKRLKNIPRLNRKWNSNDNLALRPIGNQNIKFWNYASESEINLLKKIYHELPIRQLLKKYFPHRSYCWIQSNMKKLKLKTNFGHRQYTLYEDNYLRDFFGILDDQEIATHLNRTINSIRKRAPKIGCGLRQTGRLKNRYGTNPRKNDK